MTCPAYETYLAEHIKKFGVMSTFMYFPQWAQAQYESKESWKKIAQMACKTIELRIGGTVDLDLEHSIWKALAELKETK